MKSFYRTPDHDCYYFDKYYLFVFKARHREMSYYFRSKPYDKYKRIKNGNV